MTEPVKGSSSSPPPVESTVFLHDGLLLVDGRVSIDGAAEVLHDLPQAAIIGDEIGCSLLKDLFFPGNRARRGIFQRFGCRKFRFLYLVGT